MRKSQWGVTLVELMVTLAVLAIIVSIATAVPDILDKRRVVGAAESAYSELQFARSEAIKQSRDIYVNVSPGNTWCVGVSDSPGCDCTGGGQACTIHYGGEDVLRVVNGADLPGVTMSTTSASEIAFDSIRGMLDGGGNGTLTFTSAQGDDVSVVVSVMGRVRVCGDAGGYPSC